jgi:hypothetical protein
MDRGEEVARGFVVARCNGPELLKFAEEILDQATRLVKLVLVQTAKARHIWREHAFGGLEPGC